MKANAESIRIIPKGVRSPNVEKLIQEVKASENQEETLAKLAKEIIISVMHHFDEEEFWVKLQEIQQKIEIDLGNKNVIREILNANIKEQSEETLRNIYIYFPTEEENNFRSEIRVIGSTHEAKILELNDYRMLVDKYTEMDGEEIHWTDEQESITIKIEFAKFFRNEIEVYDHVINLNNSNDINDKFISDLRNKIVGQTVQMKAISQYQFDLVDPSILKL
jgi:hypothetical protein